MTVATSTVKDDRTPPMRVAVQVMVYSESLAPAEITARLGLEPTATAEKGVKHGKRTNTAIDVPRNMWQLSSESHGLGADLTSHLEWVLSKLSPARERLRALRDDGSIQCALVGVVWTSGTSVHVRLPTRLMEMLVALQLEFQLEFADYGQDD